MTRLSALKVKSAGPGRHGDGEGLYLLVKPTGGRSWVLRIQNAGKRQDIGLGSVDLGTSPSGSAKASDEIPLLSRRKLTLQEAREKARELRKFLLAGRDPIVERDRERRKVPTFEEAARACHKKFKEGWSERQADTFLSSLERHAFPRLGRLPVNRIEPSDIQAVLAPIWTTLSDMSVKVRARIATVLDYSYAQGWRATKAPGRAVSMLLPKRAKTGNYSAMPYAHLPVFVHELNGKPATVGRLALLFVIFTACRSGEVRQAKWAQIDLGASIWHCPPEIMKSKKEHDVTLSTAACEILARAKKLNPPQPDDLVFPNVKGGLLSDMTLSKILRDAGQSFHVHGFRSTFRDWAAEKMPEIPDPVAEAALAHAVPDAVIAAYKRTNFIEMRRTLLAGWGNFLLNKDQ